MPTISLSGYLKIQPLLLGYTVVSDHRVATLHCFSFQNDDDSITYAHLIPLIALKKPSDDVRLHKPFPSVVHCIAELSHKLHFFFAKRTLAECHQVFLKLFNIGRRHQADIDVGIRENKTIAHTSGGNELVF